MGRGWCCFPLYAAQAPGCSIWRVPCAARSSSPQVFHKSPEQKAAPAFCAFPIRAAQAARGLTGALSPGAVHLLPSASPAPLPTRASRVCSPCVSPRPSRWMSTIQNLRRYLIRNWRPVCSVVGAAVLGAKLAAFPSLLPPVSGGSGPLLACELFSGLSRSLCSVNGWQCVRAG